MLQILKKLLTSHLKMLLFFLSLLIFAYLRTFTYNLKNFLNNNLKN